MYLNDHQLLLLEALKRPEVRELQRFKKLYQRLGAESLRKVAEENWADLTVAYHLLESPDIPERDRNLWQSVYNSYVDSDQVVWEWLNRVILKMAESGHELLFLKDTGLSLCVYPVRLYRRHEDVDILALPEAYKQVEILLGPLGFQIGFDDPYQRSYEYMSVVNAQKECTMDVEGVHLKFEFHLRPHAGKWIRPEQEPDPVGLFRHSMRIPLENGVTVRVMDYENNLLHECIHAARHFFVLDKAIRMYVDIDRLAATEKIEWSVFIRLAHHHRVVLPARIALRLAKELLLTEIPDHVFDALPVSPWRERVFLNWVYRLGVFEPSKQKLSRVQRFLFYGLLADSWLDSLHIAVRTFFLPVSHLKLRYSFKSNWLIPYYYVYNVGRIILRQRL